MTVCVKCHFDVCMTEAARDFEDVYIVVYKQAGVAVAEIVYAYAV